MDSLFWRIKDFVPDHQFAWIQWYIWKSRNDKVFNDFDKDPRDTLILAESEFQLWNEAQIEKETMVPDRVGHYLEENQPLSLDGRRWCFTEASWKENDDFSGQGWYSVLEGFDGLMGARNTRPASSPLHKEMEDLLWAMECMKRLRQVHVTFATDSTLLVKMVSDPEEWPAFAFYIKDFRKLQQSFSTFSLQYVPRSHNKKADSLARGARSQTTSVYHMD